MGIADTDRNPRSIQRAFREAMPVTRSWAYFDHAAVGPIPRRSAQAIHRWLDQATEEGDVHWPEWSAAAALLRQRCSELLHCRDSEIALVPNTTFGINVIAMGYRWRSGDSVVVLENEFPSNLLPWRMLADRGVEVRVVPVEESGVVAIDRIRNAIDATTRIVTVSWVGYASGFRVNLAELCEVVHRAGAQLFVDAIQGLGVFPLDTRSIPIDYAAADGHKWMLGPEGAGLLFIRESNLDRIQPMMVGWNSIVASHEFRSDGATLKPNASRFEGGSANHAGLIGLSESVGLLLGLDCHQHDSPVARMVLENAAMLRETIQQAGGELAYPRVAANGDAESLQGNGSGIIGFDLPGCDPMLVRRRMLAAGVVLSVRHGRLRVATHAYNDESEFERFGRELVASKRALTLGA